MVEEEEDGGRMGELKSHERTVVLCCSRAHVASYIMILNFLAISLPHSVSRSLAIQTLVTIAILVVVVVNPFDSE
ncbi:hypothetical protein, partial [Escherichia coli]|uniref:hypothetical protein n=1 Tax=Escherichia coli TaxID=562 RepID=UPI00211C9D42